MLEKQTICLRQLAGNRAGEVRLGRWLANDAVSTQEIINHITNNLTDLVVDRHVLGIQDTTEINHQSHRNKVSGLGKVGGGENVGFFLHPMMVIDANDQTCLGLSAIKTWVRDDSDKSKYKSKPIEDKESYRWVEVANQSKIVLSSARQITVIADRESDIYEEWYRVPDEKTHLIIRACYDRNLTNQQSLFDYIGQQQPAQTYEFEVKARPKKNNTKRSSHIATMEIRFAPVAIKKPASCKDKLAPASIQLTAIDVKEISKTVIDEEEPIHWCLLTTHKVSNPEEALQIVNWYRARWNIEQLFRTIKKQGLDVESSQVESVAGLIKLTTIAVYIAIVTMQLTLARQGKDQVISTVFNPAECQVLSKLQKKLEGKTKLGQNPYPPNMLSYATWTIARLGGWKGYKSESPPGPITILRGLRKFEAILEGYEVFKMCA